MTLRNECMPLNHFVYMVQQMERFDEGNNLDVAQCTRQRRDQDMSSMCQSLRMPCLQFAGLLPCFTSHLVHRAARNHRTRRSICSFEVRLNKIGRCPLHPPMASPHVGVPAPVYVACDCLTAVRGASGDGEDAMIFRLTSICPSLSLLIDFVLKDSRRHIGASMGS
jgi:hypothetical protein